MAKNLRSADVSESEVAVHAGPSVVQEESEIANKTIEKQLAGISAQATSSSAAVVPGQTTGTGSDISTQQTLAAIMTQMNEFRAAIASLDSRLKQSGQNSTEVEDRQQGQTMQSLDVEGQALDDDAGMRDQDSTGVESRQQGQSLQSLDDEGRTLDDFFGGAKSRRHKGQQTMNS